MSTSPLSPPSLIDWSDDALAGLLRARPDLASPLPGSLTALAGRAATARSVRLALGELDEPHLAVLDAVIALAALGAGVAAAESPEVSAPAAVTAAAVAVSEAEVAAATGLEPAAPLAHLAALALLVPGWRPAPGVAAARPRPANLAVTVPAVLDDPPSPATLTRGARRVLDALTWGPPVGTFGGAVDGDLTTAVEELLEHSYVRRTADGGVVLPGSTAFALRGRRTHRDLAATPPTPTAVAVPPPTRAAESARAALELHQYLADVLALWGSAPPGALRSGGIGVREIRRTSVATGAGEATTVLLAELAAAADEIGPTHDDDGALWAPTHSHDDDPSTLRWARLADTWLHSERAFALVGTRADDGALRSTLEPGLERGWARPLRRRVLEALQAWPDGAAPDLPAVLTHLTWHTPSAPPPDWAVQAVMAEAATLGVTGAGSLGAAGRALLGSSAPGSRETLAAVAAALEADLPPAVEEILLQADLTAVVPGRPSREIEDLLVRTAEIESRGSGLTARFTSASLSRAVESGLSAQDVLDALHRLSRTGVPQPLEYAVHDAARRHGGLRAGPATTYLRSDDPVALAALLHLSNLDLRLLAPTVAVTSLPAARLAMLLRDSGRPVLVEGPDGAVISTSAAAAVAVSRRPRHSAAGPNEGTDLTASVRRLREGQAAAANAGPKDPAGGVALLREAVRTHTAVFVTVVGPSGAADRRRVVPLRVQGGQVVARDLDRESDLTIALHRIADVAPI